MVVMENGIDRVFSFPCGIKYIGNDVGKNSAKFEESRTGILLFSTFQNRPLCYVLSTFTPNSTAIKKGKWLTFKNSSKSIRVVLKVSKKYQTVFGSPIIAWECSDFEQQQKAIFKPKLDWNMSSNGSDKVENEPTILSWFILYQLDANEMSKLDFDKLRCQASSLCTDFHIRTGQPIETRSYPFGPDIMEIFTSAVSTGIISNVSLDKSLFLIDARCLPGSEGGSVITLVSHKLVGIIVAPLCWKNQELVGFSVCCSVQSIFSSLQNVLQSNPIYDVRILVISCLKAFEDNQLLPSKNKGPTVVRIDVAGIWGSGVVVAATKSKNLCEVTIVTCRHVVENAIGRNHVKISVIFENGKSYIGKLLFASDEASAYDLAVLNVEIDRSSPENLCLKQMHEYELANGRQIFMIPYSKHFSKGSPIHVKGYPLFDVDIDLGATVCSGVLSNISYNNADAPILLHSTCLVHRGSSGGGLICSVTGELQGIVVNHVKDENCNVSYPDVNFSIPCNVFMPVVLDYLLSQERDLNSLNCYDNDVVRAWNMEPSHLNDREPKIKSKL
ncbi:peroxisomal leader peptide-processing protease-like [Styela clava]